MKKGILIFLFIAFFSGFSQANLIRLGLINPTPENLEKIVFLIDNDYIELDNIELVGIFHESQNNSIKHTNEFIKKNGYTNVSVSTIKNSIPMDSLFVENKCTNEFNEIFQKTDGLIFLGGADISPELYGEKTFLTTELIPSERNWEISFLFHLLGGFQNKDFVPLLEQKPTYLILGICLGMQEMNVASGGSLYQDIPFQIYKKTTYESVLNQDSEKQHKNYRNKINNWTDNGSILHFHHIRIISNSILDYKQIQNPLVTSTHHQSVKKLGENFKISAVSMDKKVVEAMENSRYPNVYGIQFHAEVPILYKQTEFKNSQDKIISFDTMDKQFHLLFWKNFSVRLDNKK